MKTIVSLILPLFSSILFEGVFPEELEKFRK